MKKTLLCCLAWLLLSVGANAQMIVSPDMNPTLNEYQALLINSSTNHANLQVLLDSSEEYMIGKDETGRIIGEVKAGVKHWKSIAIRLGMAKRDGCI